MKPHGILKYVTGGDKWKGLYNDVHDGDKKLKLTERYDRFFIKKCYQIES